MEQLAHKIGIASDAEIIQKILSGEPALFEVLIRRFNPVLYKIGRGFGFNHQDAQDLMQDAYISAYQNLQQFSHRSSCKTWISRIMINKCLYKLNHGYYKNEHSGSDILNEQVAPVMANDRNLQPEQFSANKEFMRVLEKSLEQLSLIYRSVFILREVEGFSVAETAELLSITPVNVKVRLNRAKSLLQKELEQFYSGKELYEFNLVYCDEMVTRVYQAIDAAKI